MDQTSHRYFQYQSQTHNHPGTLVDNKILCAKSNQEHTSGEDNE